MTYTPKHSKKGAGGFLTDMLPPNSYIMINDKEAPAQKIPFSEPYDLFDLPTALLNKKKSHDKH